MAQEAEHVLGKDEVTGSNPVISSRKADISFRDVCFFLCVSVKTDSILASVTSRAPEKVQPFWEEDEPRRE